MWWTRREHPCGVLGGAASSINTLAYAEDILQHAKSEEERVHMHRESCATYAPWGLGFRPDELSEGVPRGSGPLSWLKSKPCASQSRVRPPGGRSRSQLTLAPSRPATDSEDGRQGERRVGAVDHLDVDWPTSDPTPSRLNPKERLWRTERCMTRSQRTSQLRYQRTPQESQRIGPPGGAWSR